MQTNLENRLNNVFAEHIATHLTSDDRLPQNRTTTAAQARVLQDGQLLFHAAFGHNSLEANPTNDNTTTTDTLFDIASVNKLITATLTMQAVDQNLFDWHTPISDLLPNWNPTDPRAQTITILQLLNHSSGLPAWIRFYEWHPLDPSPEQATITRQNILQEIAALPLTQKPGTFYAYSDPGYILLGFILEHVFSTPLEETARKNIFEPLEMHDTNYVSIRHPQTTRKNATHDVASTERCALRKRLVTGTVHDENCNILGGVAGHAGVFSTAQDLAKFATHMLDIDAKTPPTNAIVQPQTLKLCWSDATRSKAQNPANHLAGWDTPSGLKSSAGRGFSAGNSVGHLGFTGTSLWIERNSRTIAVLLTNRVYPTRENDRIKSLRIAFHEAVLTPPANKTIAI